MPSVAQQLADQHNQRILELQRRVQADLAAQAEADPSDLVADHQRERPRTPRPVVGICECGPHPVFASITEAARALSRGEIKVVRWLYLDKLLKSEKFTLQRIDSPALAHRSP